MSIDDQKQAPQETLPAATPSESASKPEASVPAQEESPAHQEVFPYHRIFVLVIDTLLILAVGIVIFLYVFARPNAPIVIEPEEGSTPIEQPIAPEPPVDVPTLPEQITPTDPVIVPGEEITITPEKSSCKRTGCSGQICSDRDMVSTCEFREEYRCYATARCERQADGACGWTETPELQSCLLNPPPLE